MLREQLRSHLQKLTAVAVRERLDDEDNNIHPHAIEAIRQVTGDLFADISATLPGTPKPYLLHEPYMSAAGAAGLRSQTLKDLAGEVTSKSAYEEQRSWVWFCFPGWVITNIPL